MKPIAMNLALQGGGAHGAFTWGVLHRLLEEPWFEIEGISGTSAGAMNAVMVAEGWRNNGRDGAKQCLDDFWHSVSADSGNFQLPRHLEESVTKWWLNIFQFFSPYDVNLLDVNPLRDIVAKHVDFSTLRQSSPIKLFIAATEVASGKLTIFRETSLTLQHLLASACLPNIHHAIEIGGKHYWDGGFSGNPAVYPLLHDCRGKELLIVLLQSLQTPTPPRKAQAISDRITELTFHSTFMREMRAIANFRADKPRLPFLASPLQKRVNAMHIHLLENDTLMSSLSQASKYNNRKSFLRGLKDEGIAATEKWLHACRDDLGKRDTVDIVTLFG